MAYIWVNMPWQYIMIPFLIFAEHISSEYSKGIYAAYCLIFFSYSLMIFMTIFEGALSIFHKLGYVR